MRDLLLEPGTTCRAKIGIEQWLGEPHGTRGVLNPLYIGIEKSLGLKQMDTHGTLKPYMCLNSMCQNPVGLILIEDHSIMIM